MNSIEYIWFVSSVHLITLCLSYQANVGIINEIEKKKKTAKY